MFRLFLFLSGLVSLLFFLFPSLFPDVRGRGEKVLGAKTFNQAVNRDTVYTAVLAYCLDRGHLPSDLDQLYERDLDQEKWVDLGSLYRLGYTNLNSCEFSLENI